jgi:predicted ATPase
MERILLRDVRCFGGEHDIPFAPLTFLVGENSTGKSTLLAMTRIAWDVGRAAQEPDFNDEPFQLGAFPEISHVNASGAGSPSFLVGFRALFGENGVATVRAQFLNRTSQPFMDQLEMSIGDWQVVGTSRDGELYTEISSTCGAFPQFEASLDVALTGEEFSDFSLWQIRGKESDLGLSPEAREDLRRFREAMLTYSRTHWPRPLAVAPVRTRPKRTYDPLKESRSPEGYHVPMLLARLRATAPTVWEALAADLAEYGRGAGLFSDLLVRRFDGGESSPFQVQVRLAGQHREVNLVDVGYGVSQVLPILVDAFTQPDESSFLLQQPEVHLHPRAQAELGTILASLVRRKRHKFMIETHSDHLVDRVRLEVRRGKLPAESVRIVYCERADSQVLTREIKLDSKGNLIGAPESYRQFFLNEELAILGG